MTVPDGTDPTTENLVAALRSGRTAAVGASISTWQFVTRAKTNASNKTQSLF